MWRAEDPQGDEAAKIKWLLVPYTRGKVLDVGCGPWKPFAHFTGVDNMHHAQMFGWQFEPDVKVADCSELGQFATGGWDAVFSAHTLEHIKDFEAALKEWWRLVKVGGHLCLYLPHKDFYPNIGQAGSNPDHKHDFLPRDITEAMGRNCPGWSLIENEERNEGREYSFFQVYRKRTDDRCVIGGWPWKKEGSKMACVVRYGGFGDMIQASSIFPALKEDGWHITVMTTPKGRAVLEGNPHVDRYLLQDNHPDQVPNHELGAYWDAWRPRFDRFINLCESVEGSLLGMPGRANHGWPQPMRHKLMNINYLEFTHAIAQVPLPPRPGFFPKDEDIEWCVKNVLPMQGFLIMYALAGSSVHKAYPHMDALIARIMLDLPEAKVVLVGDEVCTILEAGWEKEERVVKTCGKWGIRQAMTAAREMDVVIGPETGIMNSVAMCENAKIVMLSHSSAENLTKYWVNTDTVMPDVHCHPCHRMHYGFEHCHEWKVPAKDHPIGQDEETLKDAVASGAVVDGIFSTGASICAAAIPVDGLMEIIKDHYERWRSGRIVAANAR